MMHFSQLYRPDEIAGILDARLPPALRTQVVPFVPARRALAGLSRGAMAKRSRPRPRRHRCRSDSTTPRPATATAMRWQPRSPTSSISTPSSPATAPMWSPSTCVAAQEAGMIHGADRPRQGHRHAAADRPRRARSPSGGAGVPARPTSAPVAGAPRSSSCVRAADEATALVAVMQAPVTLVAAALMPAVTLVAMTVLAAAALAAAPPALATTGLAAASPTALGSPRAGM